jgi:ankyrin repeat protein
MIGRGVARLIVAMLAVTNVQAASHVADAVMKRDAQAVRSLLQQKADVNAAQVDGTTALHWAARWNDLDTAASLIRAGANAGAANRYGVTPVSLASLNGSAAMLELLLKAGADPNAAAESGETILMTAANSGSVDAVKVLLKYGAEVNAKEKINGQTALMWAAIENHVEVVKLLIANGADIHACTNIDLVNSARGFIITNKGVPTLPCVKGGRQGALPALPTAQAADAGLNDDPFQAPAGARGGARGGGRGGRPPGPPLGGSGGGAMTPFLFSVRQGATESLQALLAAGSDVNQTMADGTSPLVVAIINGHYSLAKFLLENGADPNIADARGRAALYAAVDMRNYRWAELPKPAGDPMDPLDLINLLLAKGANPNVRLTANIPYRGPSNFSNVFETMVGATPFLRAAESGDVAVMRLLLEHGADPKIKTIDNKTALMLASGVGYSDGSTFEWSQNTTLEAVKLCLELGEDVNAASDRGLTAIHGAAHRGSNAILQYLAQKGARLDAKDKQGRTPLTWAEGVVVIDQRPARPQPHTVALIKQMTDSR